MTTTDEAVAKVIDKTGEVISKVAEFTQQHAGEAFDIAAQSIQVPAILHNAASLIVFVASVLLFRAYAAQGFKEVSEAEYGGEAKQIKGATKCAVGLVSAIAIAVSFFDLLTPDTWYKIIAPKLYLVRAVMEAAGVK